VRPPLYAEQSIATGLWWDGGRWVRSHDRAMLHARKPEKRPGVRVVTFVLAPLAWVRVPR